LKDFLEEKDTYFDVVMAIDVFEHVEDYLGFIRRLRVKGEYKVFHIPLDLSVQTVLRVSPIR
jgi:2-polyprenyl-3-methyl-5-hydroxy-6-metoxy-1,4-benzoquinol methylase